MARSIGPEAPVLQCSAKVTGGNSRVDVLCITALDIHRIKFAVLGHAMVIVVVLVLKDFIIIRLASSTTRRPCWDARMHDDVVVARLVVAKVVLASAEHHDCSPQWTGAVGGGR